MHPNAALITSFYEAFQRQDADTMGACYHADATFSDPAFPALAGAEPPAMWAMLCDRATDLEVTFRDIVADDETGSAHWEATYTFSATGRKVHNVIEASFRFQDGKIIQHVDRFPLWKWTRMALGPMGVVLGWTPLVQGKVRAQAASGLRKWMQRHPTVAA